MLQNIIKRNGEIEPFDARKFSAWAEWANKNLPNVNMNLIVINAINKIKQDKITSDQLQNVLIDACVETDKESEQYNIMAGRLHVASAIKKIHKGELPHLRDHILNLINEKVLIANDYTEKEHNQLQDIIDHDRSYNYPYYQSKYLISKYSLQNRITNQKYETPQFIYMRMAMALVDKKYYPSSEDRIKAVKRFYDHFSLNKLNAPSPAYFNLGTSHKGYNSCLLYKAGDSIDSLNIGNSITFKFTALSAGIGGNIDCRSMGDPIRYGAVKHSGKIGYYRSTESNVHANVQGGRGGNATMYYNSYDPDCKSITMAQSIKTPSDNRIRGIHFAALHNRFLAEQVMQDKDIMHFNCFTAPDLNAKLYSSDYEGFKELYNKYLHDEKFPKKFSNALDLTVNQLQQSLEVGTLYQAFIDEMNRHTPFKETIYSSNLCVEITQPTKDYNSELDLFLQEDHGRGEVSMCSLGAINVSIEMSDEEYLDVAKSALEMVDYFIDNSTYAYPHIEYTVKNRRNAAIGMIGVATVMARKNLSYDSVEGRNELFLLAERHAYFLTLASLQLGIERGNAPWMHKTKWPEGWTYAKSYTKNVNKLITVKPKYDWDALSKRIIANGGIRNSCLISHMPTESSSKGSGAPNGVYPIREINLLKTDDNNAVEWVAKESDILKERYQKAYSVDNVDLIKAYSVIQAWTDGSISADLYVNRSVDIKVKASQLIKEYLTMQKYGLKTRYYYNTKAAKAKFTAKRNRDIPMEITKERGCAGGACDV